MIELLLGPDKIRVSTEDITAVSINYSLKDIRNYGGRNIPFSKPITVVKNQETEKVFKSLFNMNVVNGYTISNMVDGELQENGVTILKGPIQVVEPIMEDSYNIIISGAEFNLFNEMGDKLIVGNLDTDDDITFPDDEYQHTYNRDLIRSELRRDPSNNGKGFTYPIIDYTNNLNEADDLSADYVLLPAIAVREIFDGIFDKYGYTYELSDDISTYINQMYIPFNDDVQKYTTDWNFAYYRLGEETVLYKDDEYKEINKVGLDENPTEAPTPYLGPPYYTGVLRGIDIKAGDNNFDYIYDINDGSTGFGYIIPKNGKYNITVNLLFGAAYYWAPIPEWAPILSLVDQDVFIYVERNELLFNTFKLGTASADNVTTEGEFEYFSKTLNDVELEKNDIIYIAANNTDQDAALDIKYHRMAVRWDSSSNFSIIEQNSFLGNNNIFDLNDLRPYNFKQADFITDLFKMFNCFVEVDDNDSKKIIIKSYNYYYLNPTIKDWTEKLDNKDSGHKSLKNEFAKQIIFQYSEDDDLFNKDFMSKYGYPFNYNIINNDSEFADKVNKITLSIVPTIFKTIEEV